MGIVQGTFIYKGVPRNGATAKLWQASVFGAPPVFDEAEPGSGQVGSTITTGIAYGGDGAYRWTAISDGAYYVSIFYDTHRVWQYHHVEDIASILTTQGDILVRGASVLERKAKGSEGQVLTISGGIPAWAEPVPVITEELATTVWNVAWTIAWSTLYTLAIPATAKKVMAWLAARCGIAGEDYNIQILYNGVQKAFATHNQPEDIFACHFADSGVGILADVVWQQDSTADTSTRRKIGGCWSAK